jgi:hypothetical protein
MREHGFFSTESIEFLATCTIRQCTNGCYRQRNRTSLRCFYGLDSFVSESIELTARPSNEILS